MTKDIRDRIAELMGWTFDECGSCMHHPTLGKFIDRHRDHPIPDTLDGAAACMPKGVAVSIRIEPDGSVNGYAYKGDGFATETIKNDSGCEKDVRFRLACAALKALESQK